MYKRTLSMLLGIMLVLGLAGIASGEEIDKSNWLFGEEVTITLMESETSNQPYPKDNPLVEEIYKRTGVRLDLQIVTSDYSAKCNTLIATGDMPDIMYVGRTEVAVPMISSGQFLKVSDYFDLMPNYIERTSHDPNFPRMATAEGDHYYLITSTERVYGAYTAPAIREDLLAETGLDVPDNYDELYEVLKAIKANHPDTFPISSRWSYARIFETMAFPMGSGWDATIVVYYEPTTQKWTYGATTPEFKAIVEYFRTLYAEGLLDPDYTVNESSNFKERYASGQSSFHFENSTFLVNYNSILADTIGPEAKFIPMPLPENSNGQRRQYGASFYNKDDAIVINGSAKNPEQLVQFVDWFYSPEGVELTNWGVEGVTFQYNADGERELIPEFADQFRGAADPWRAMMSSWSFGQLGLSFCRDEGTQAPYLDEESLALYAYLDADDDYVERIMPPSFTEDELEELAELYAAIVPVLDPALEGMVTGSVSIDTFDDVAAQVNAIGGTRIEEIYNNAEQRMMDNQ